MPLLQKEGAQGAKVCRTKARDEGNKMADKTHQVIEAIEDSHNEGLEDSTYSLYKMTSGKCDPIMTMVTTNGVELKMEVDTGASVSIIIEYIYNNCGLITCRHYRKPQSNYIPTLEKLCRFMGLLLLMSHTMTKQTPCLSW